MSAHTWILLIIIKSLSFSLLANAGCPETLPDEIEGKCYRFNAERLSFSNARDGCMKLESGAKMATVKTQTTLKSIEDIVYDYLISKLEKALFWIGFKMDDTDATKPAEYRYWKWDYDDSQIIQKDYTLWDKNGGPTDKTLTCAAIDASNNYLVKPVDCGAPVLPLICLMKEGESCEDNVKSYLMYGNYCLAAVNGVYEYNKIHGTCSPSNPTPYTEEIRKYVINAAKNYFLGGGIFLYLTRSDSTFIDGYDNSDPPSEMWEEREPRDKYNCAGLSIQSDNTLKLKALNCDFIAASLCFIDSSDASNEINIEQKLEYLIVF